jgi:hypothetical protein
MARMLLSLVVGNIIPARAGIILVGWSCVNRDYLDQCFFFLAVMN